MPESGRVQTTPCALQRTPCRQLLPTTPQLWRDSNPRRVHGTVFSPCPILQRPSYRPFAGPSPVYCLRGWHCW